MTDRPHVLVLLKTILIILNLYAHGWTNKD